MKHHFDPTFMASMTRINERGYRVSGGHSCDSMTLKATSRTGERFVVTYIEGPDNGPAIRAAHELAKLVGVVIGDE